MALGKGDGTFLSAKQYDSFAACCIVTADFNGDGILDLAVGNLYGMVGVLYGNGDGTFQESVNFDACQVWGLGTADLNGDGIPDLAIYDDGSAYGMSANSIAVALNKRH